MKEWRDRVLLGRRVNKGSMAELQADIASIKAEIAANDAKLKALFARDLERCAERELGDEPGSVKQAKAIKNSDAVK
jgi:hypothetical protein